MRWALVPLLLGALGCEGPDALRHEPLPEAELDPRLGAHLLTASSPRQMHVSWGVGPTHADALVFLGAGRDLELRQAEPSWRFFRVALDDERVTEVDPPPAVPSEAVMGVAVGEDATVVAVAASDTHSEVLARDGSAWRALGSAPVPLSEITILYARGADRIVLRAGTRLFHHDGRSFAELAFDEAPTGLLVGPMERDRFRVVYTTADALVSEVRDFATGAVMGEPTGMEGDWPPLQLGAMNGTLDDFTFLVSGFTLRLRGGALEVVSRGPEAAIVHPAPGSATALYSSSFVASEGLRRVEEGVIGDYAYPPFSPALGCECSRPVDRDCACLPREPRVQLIATHDAQAAVMLSVDTVDATRRVHARTIALPTNAGPFLPDPSWACTEMCDIDGEGLECVWDTHGRPACAPRGSVPPGEHLDVGPLPHDTPDYGEAFYGATLVGKVTRASDGWPADMTVEAIVAGSRWEEVFPMGSDRRHVAVEPLTGYRLTFTADGHEPRVFELTAPGFDRTLDFGDHVLPIEGTLTLGVAWGDEGEPPSGAVAPDGTLVVPLADGWALVTDGGGELEVRRVPGSPGVNSLGEEGPGDRLPSVVTTPDGEVALVELATGFAAVELSSATVVGVIERPVDMTTVGFAARASVAFVQDRATAHAGVTVFDWADATLTERVRVDTPGSYDALTPDGATLHRLEDGAPASMASYSVADGARSVLRAAAADHTRLAFTGAGDFAYIERNRRSPAPVGIECWSERPEGCGITASVADGTAVDVLSFSGLSIVGYAASADSAHLFVASQSGGAVAVQRYTMAGGFVPLGGFSVRAPFRWVAFPRAVGFPDDRGFHVVDLVTAETLGTAPGVFDEVLRRHDLAIVNGDCSAGSCDLVLMDASGALVARVEGGSGGVHLGAAYEDRVGVLHEGTTALTIGGESVIRAAPADIAIMEPVQQLHMGAPCWPYALGSAGARRLFCAR